MAGDKMKKNSSYSYEHCQNCDMLQLMFNKEYLGKNKSPPDTARLLSDKHSDEETCNEITS